MTFERGSNWVLTRLTAGADILELWSYIDGCFRAGIANDFHRGARETLESISPKEETANNE